MSALPHPQLSIMTMARAIMSLVLLWLVPALALGQEQTAVTADTGGTVEGTGVPVDPDDDFVRASLIVAAPGRELYSVLGHAALRLQCPTHGLDYVFSEESEDARNRVLEFFAGRLRMNVLALPAEEYIGKFGAEGRAVDEYELHLPIAVKQRLWQQMDGRLETSEGPYDYLRRSCALSVLRWLMEAVDADSLKFGPWPEYYAKTRKELTAMYFDDMWARFYVLTFAGGASCNTDVPYVDKVLAPAQLLEVLGRTTAYGKPIISFSTNYPPPFSI